MFWINILLIMLLVIGASVIFGMMLQRRTRKQRGRLSRQEQLTMAKASGAFPHRKESGP